MPRSSYGLIALVLCGCALDSESLESDPESAARRGGPDRFSHGWHHDGDHPRAHKRGGRHDHDHASDKTPTVASLLDCLEDCLDDDDDDCPDHHWRHGGHDDDDDDEADCQAIWDGLDDDEKAEAREAAGDTLDACVDAGPPADPCQDFVAEDDIYVVVTGFDPLPYAFDLFENDLETPEGHDVVVVAANPPATIRVGEDGRGQVDAIENGDFITFTYEACCVQPSGEVSDVCDMAGVMFLGS